MELSKETYQGSPEKKDIKSIVSDIMQDEAIVGKQTKPPPPEKKRRGRPPKNPKKTDDEQTTQNEEVPVKKPRGRPRKIKDSQTETIQEKQPQIDPQIDPQTHLSDNHDIIPFIQNFSSTHPLHKLPNKTIKYIIFLIQLFQNNPQLHTHLPTHTLHTLLHTFYHTHNTYTYTTNTTKHLIFSALSTDVDTELNTKAI